MLEEYERYLLWLKEDSESVRKAAIVLIQKKDM